MNCFHLFFSGNNILQQYTATMMSITIATIFLFQPIFQPIFQQTIATIFLFQPTLSTNIVNQHCQQTLSTNIVNQYCQPILSTNIFNQSTTISGRSGDQRTIRGGAVCSGRFVVAHQPHHDQLGGNGHCNPNAECRQHLAAAALRQPAVPGTVCGGRRQWDLVGDGSLVRSVG